MFSDVTVRFLVPWWGLVLNGFRAEGRASLTYLSPSNIFVAEVKASRFDLLGGERKLLPFVVASCHTCGSPAAA